MRRQAGRRTDATGVLDHEVWKSAKPAVLWSGLGCEVADAGLVLGWRRSDG